MTSIGLAERCEICGRRLGDPTTGHECLEAARRARRLAESARGRKLRPVRPLPPSVPVRTLDDEEVMSHDRWADRRDLN